MMRLSTLDSNSNMQFAQLRKAVHLNSVFKRNRFSKDSVDMQNPDDRQAIIDILQVTKDRSRLELEFLRRAFKQLSFFQEKVKPLGESAQLRLYQSLNHIFVPAKSVLFHYGDPGETYYVILRGSVSVLIPNSKYKLMFKRGKLTPEIVKQEFEKNLMCFQQNSCHIQSSLNSPSKQQVHLDSSESSLNKINLPQISVAKFPQQLSESKLSDEIFRTEKQINISNILRLKDASNLTDQLRRESLGMFSVKKPNLQRKSSLKLKIKEENDEEDDQENSIDDFEARVFKEFECVNTMSVGEGFGELALLQSDNRSATILSREDCDFAIINRAQFQKIVKAYHDRLREHKIDDLARFKCLQFLEREDLKTMVQMLSMKKLKLSEVIYKENQDSDYVYFINSGQVELSTEMEKGQRIRVASLGENEVFGWEEILSNTKRIYRAVCIESCDVYQLSRQQFREFLSFNEEFLRYFHKEDEIRGVHRSSLVRQSMDSNLTSKNKLISLLQNQNKKNNSDEILQERFKSVSHVQDREQYKEKIKNRKYNLKSLRFQEGKQALNSEPMFPIQAEKILEQRVQGIDNDYDLLLAIQIKYAIMQGNYYENQKYKNYIYKQSKSPTRSELNLKNMLSHCSRDDIGQSDQVIKSKSQTRALNNSSQLNTSKVQSLHSNHKNQLTKQSKRWNILNRVLSY